MDEVLKIPSIKIRQIFFLLALGIIPFYVIARLTQYKFFFIYTAFVFYNLLILSFYYRKALFYTVKNNVLMIGLFASFYVSSVWSINRGEVLWSSFVVTIYLLVYMIFCFIVVNYTHKDIEGIYMFIPVFLFVLNVVLIYKYGNIRVETVQVNEFIISRGGEATDLIGIERVRDVLRSFPNHMVALVEVCIPFLLYFIKFQRRKLFLYMILALALFDVFISQSLSAYAVLIIVLVMTSLMYSRNAFRFIKYMFAMLLVVGIIFSVLLAIPRTNRFINITWYRLARFSDNVQTFVEGGEEEAGNRIKMYKTGFKIIRKHPVLGVGFDNFGAYMQKIYGFEVISHNVIFTVWTGSGIIGLILFLSIIFKAFKNLWRKHKHYYRSNPELSYWFLANWIALLLLLIHGQTRPLLNNPVFYLPLAVGLMSKDTASGEEEYLKRA